MAHYLIELPDEASESSLVQALAHLAASVRWVATSPDETYDYEWAYTDENSWDAISQAVEEIINDIQLDDESEWPPYPYDQWPVKQRRRLIYMAVTQWNYLGPNGVDPDELRHAYRSGALHACTRR